MVGDYVSTLAGRHFQIVTILEKPFVMLKSDNYDPKNMSVNVDIEGKTT